ncbi:glycosyltransferase family 4 protein [Salinibacter grassmerensis]|uniref:glycosyltransferase family 4 protein n=1 Tax=Salinibacter grassmerensis TaxID=3040353 RepID=UPI0021E87CF7|nr:glycosyltransferase family 4 protein [Salinibacter grassmerensis]
MANQLHKRGCLRSLVTSYPASEAEKFGVPKDRIHSLPHYEALQRILGRFSGWIPKLHKFEYWVKKRFENAAARHISENDDIFVGLSGVSERGLKRAKKLDIIPILERGSSHVEYQKRLLKEEVEREGIDIDMPSNKYVEKEKREYEKSDLIIVPSKFVKKSFLDKGIKESKVHNIPFGVDVEEFSPVEKKDDIFRVVFAGQMMLRKGVHYLLKAFSELDLPNSELLLIGSKRPEIDPYFKKYEGSFRFVGHKPQKELYKYYSQGTVFAMCSIEEGLAMVQPQAMACGLPLICTPNTGGSDLIREEKEGFVIPIRDVKALKEKIQWCYENRGECTEMGRRAKNRIHSNFTWDDYGDRVFKKYSEIINNNER